MKKKWIPKMIALLLVVTMLAQSLSLEAYAALTKKQTGASASAAGETDVKTEIAGELPELRGASEKHYRMSDGTFMAVAYKDPVHYRDKDGSWKEIDNTLTEKKDRNGKSIYETANHKNKAHFFSELEDGSLFTASMDEYAVSMKLLDVEETVVDEESSMDDEGTTTEEAASTIEETATTTGEAATATEEAATTTEEAVTATEEAETTTEEAVTATEEAGATTEMTAAEEATTVLRPEAHTKIHKRSFDRNAKADVLDRGAKEHSTGKERSGRGWHAEELSPEKLESSVLYEDVFPEVDLLYTAYSYDIKEQIIVNAVQESYRYDFLLELTGLEAGLNDDGSVSLRNENDDEIYHIPAPYMEDASGIYSDAVQYTLTDSADGAVLSVEADAEWFAEEGREFPVSIDPTLSVSSKVASVDENVIRQITTNIYVKLNQQI